MVYPYATPPQSYLRDPTDVMGKRIGAFFIDAVLVIVLMVAVGLAFNSTKSLSEAVRDGDCERNRSGDFIEIECNSPFVFRSDDEVTIVEPGPFWGIYAGATLLYFGVLAGATGLTLGKTATGVRVVKKETGEIQGVGRGVARWLFFFVDGPFTLYICGLVTSLVSKGHRRVGDMVAGTLVVGKEYVGQVPVVAGLTTPPAYGPTAGYSPPPGYGQPPGYPAPPGYGQPPPGYGQPPGYGRPPPGSGQPPPSQPPWGPPPPMGPPTTPPAWPTAGGWHAPPAEPAGTADAVPPERDLPLPPTAPSDEPTTPQPPPASPTGVPAWDRERGAWMQWDPARGSWMVWNPAIRVWVPA